MKKYIYILLVIILGLISSLAYSGSLDDIRVKLDEPSGKKPVPQPIFDIQGIYKDRIQGWAWEKGDGVRLLLAITVKFRIRQKGNDIQIPHLCVYLFDRERNQVGKIEEFYYKTSTDSYQGSKNDIFKGNKTYQLQFAYAIENKFLYALAVVGNDNDCSFALLPKSAKIENFEFVEKYMVKQ